MKIFLTGQKQIGKSTCIQTFLKNHPYKVCGFQSFPYFKDNERIGFLLHSLIDLDRNDVPFSKDKETIQGVFDDFGCEILNQSNSGLLILDEIGFLERNENLYIQTLIHKIKTYPNILGVLRKSDISYIRNIKEMKDVLVLDLDEIGFDEALKTLETYSFK